MSFGSSQVEEIARTLSRSDRTFVCSIFELLLYLCSVSLIFFVSICFFCAGLQFELDPEDHTGREDGRKREERSTIY